MTHARAARKPPLRRALAMMISGSAILALGGCGGSATSNQGAAPSAAERAIVHEPLTHQQQLVEQGARLFISDGCSGCHELDQSTRYGPSFGHLAGNHVTLSDGRTALVDERFLHAALLNPAANAVRGYSPAPMIEAVKRLHLAQHSSAVAALAAFIEQIGPED